MIDNFKLKQALRALLQLNTGLWVSFSFELLTIGQTDDLKYYVTYRTDDGNVLWEMDELSLDEAIDHFVRIRSEGQLGYDFEVT